MLESCTYLGHKLDASGIRPTDDKVLSIKCAPVPWDVSELWSCLGMINYYKFCGNLSTILAPLTKLLGKGEEWIWGADQVKSFIRSKQLLQSSPLLVHYDPRLPLVLSCDVSPYGLGAVLSHRMEDSEKRPIICASLSLGCWEELCTNWERRFVCYIWVTKVS